MGTGGPTAGQTDPPLPSRGLPISWANHPLRQQQQSRLIPSGPAALPLALPPPSLLQSSPLFKMSFCSCSPDSCSILEPALGQGGWILEGRMSSWRQGGMGMGGEGEGVTGYPESSTLQGLMMVWLNLSPESAQHPPQVLAPPGSRAFSGLRMLVSPPPPVRVLDVR